MSIITRTTLQDSIKFFTNQVDLHKISKQSNIVKEKGVPFMTLLTYLISSIFTGKSTHRDYLKKKNSLDFSDKTYRNLLNDGRINWESMLTRLSKKTVDHLRPLTDKNRRNVFIVDDSIYARPNAKNVELAALQFDHANHKYVKGFRFLQLGWSDGNSFLPVAFQLISGKNSTCQPKSIDKRSNSGKRKTQAFNKSTEGLLDLLKHALKHKVKADYVLFDSWFSSPKMFQAIHELGLFSIAMVKRSKKVYYYYQGKLQDVKTIFSSEKKRRGRSRYLMSVIVEAQTEQGNLPITLVYVRNRHKRNDYLVLASTDTRLTEDEIIQLYGKRWSIEVYFKMCKQYLRLAKYQGLSFDGIFAHTTLVAISYTLLALKQREETDSRTIGELFYLMMDELADITYVEAIQQLIYFFKEVIKNEYVLDDEVLNNTIQSFLSNLPLEFQNALLVSD